ncbi:MAG: septum formation initiator family protein [Halioglobus sp.]
MRWLFAILLALTCVMAYRLLFAPGSIAEQRRLEAQVVEQESINAQLKTRNASLEREVLELKSGKKGVEQRARQELGLVREGETFYQVVDESPATALDQDQSDSSMGAAQ